MTARVFHPSLNSWEDVPDESVATWVEGGWLTDQPEHVTGDLPEVGSFAGIPQIPAESAPTGTEGTGGTDTSHSDPEAAGDPIPVSEAGAKGKHTTGGSTAGKSNT